MKKVVIYTDGSCLGNPGPGGWAAILIYNQHNKEISGGESITTNNRMELTGAIEGLKLLTEPCEVDLYTDSKYVQQGITVYIEKWRKNDWKNKAGIIKNVDLWQILDQLNSKHKVNWIWVKGHNGDQYNELVDDLAVLAANQIKANMVK